MATTSAVAVPLPTLVPMKQTLGMSSAFISLDATLAADFSATDPSVSILLNRDGLTGEHCLAHKQIAGFDQPHVCRDHIPC